MSVEKVKWKETAAQLSFAHSLTNWFSFAQFFTNEKCESAVILGYIHVMAQQIVVKQVDPDPKW